METLSKSFRQLVQVSKWGNSLAIRLPSSVVEALGPKDSIESVQPGNEHWRSKGCPVPGSFWCDSGRFRGRLFRNRRLFVQTATMNDCADSLGGTVLQAPFLGNLALIP
jgi:antitoxin MazE